MWYLLRTNLTRNVVSVTIRKLTLDFHVHGIYVNSSSLDYVSVIVLLRSGISAIVPSAKLFYPPKYYYYIKDSLHCNPTILIII